MDVLDFRLEEQRFLVPGGSDPPEIVVPDIGFPLVAEDADHELVVGREAVPDHLLPVQVIALVKLIVHDAPDEQLAPLVRGNQESVVCREGQRYRLGSTAEPSALAELAHVPDLDLPLALVVEGHQRCVRKELLLERLVAGAKPSVLMRCTTLSEMKSHTMSSLGVKAKI